MSASPPETFAPQLPRRAAALRAAMTYARTRDTDTPDISQTEMCDYWCDSEGVAHFYKCQGIIRASAKLRANGLTEPTAEIIDDVSWYYRRYGACQVDGFDVRSGGGIVLRALRSSATPASGYRGVVDLAATGRVPKPSI